MKFEIVNLIGPEQAKSQVYLSYGDNENIDLIVDGVKILCLTKEGKIHRYYISLSEVVTIPLIKVNEGGKIETNFGEGDRL